MVLRVRPTPTQFPTNTPAFYTKYGMPEGYEDNNVAIESMQPHYYCVRWVEQ